MNNTAIKIISNTVNEHIKATGKRPKRLLVSKDIYFQLRKESEPYMLFDMCVNKNMMDGIPVTVVSGPPGFVAAE